jgi:phosphoribosylaminoimidazolecarboxamide formyltransferase/IMP cyclohydrolase
MASRAADALLIAYGRDAADEAGAVAGINRTLDLETARALASTRIVAVAVPSIQPGVLELLAARVDLRVVIPAEPLPDTTGHQHHEDIEVRSTVGGVAVQTRDMVSEAYDPWPTPSLRVMTDRSPTASEWDALRFAWRLSAHVRSSTVVFASADRSLAIGTGQASTLDAIAMARMQADRLHPSALAGSAVAFDAVLSSRRELDAAADAGATAVVQAGGGPADRCLVAAANQRGLAMIFTGRRHEFH